MRQCYCLQVIPNRRLLFCPICGRKLTKALREREKELREYARTLTSAQLEVLQSLNGSLRAGEINPLCECKDRTVRYALAELQERGLIAFIPDLADMRRRLYQRTPAGEALIIALREF